MIFVFFIINKNDRWLSAWDFEIVCYVSEIVKGLFYLINMKYF